MISATKAALTGGGPSAADLAATGGMGVVLQGQVQDATEEARRRKLREQQLARLGPLGAAASSLFGDLGLQRGY